MQALQIAFDDTDSRLGRCTTHLAFKMSQELLRKNCEFLDYPNLVRLNPNIPWKTRGNGALCLRVRVRDVQDVVDFVIERIRESSAIGSGAHPGVAFCQMEDVPKEVRRFSLLAMHEVLSRQMAEKVASKSGLQFATFGNGQGLVGALGALGSCLAERDHTFELIGYRSSENCGKPRNLDRQKVIDFSTQSYPDTFNCYDSVNDRILVAPHGPDPVFLGIRGETPKVVSRGISALSPQEELAGWAVFRTNQGTNLHLENELLIATVKAYTSGFVRCIVKSKPIAGPGGHIYFAVDQAGYEMQAAVYEPTGLFHIASRLEPCDMIEIGCGVRKGTSKHPKILNVEYLQVIHLAEVFDVLNPSCPSCSKRMKSEGKGKGFQCMRCKRKDLQIGKIYVPRARNLQPGLYLPNAKAHRHLTKPLQRYGKEKRNTKTILPLEKFLFVT